MIYTKNTVFPYPVYFNNSSDYTDPEFQFDIEVSENDGFYLLQFNYVLKSEYLSSLLKDGGARLFIIFTSPFDSKIFPYSSQMQFRIDELNLSNKLRFQCFIVSNKVISFSDNFDLITFYSMIKSRIQVSSNGILGFSNAVSFNGEIKRPFEIFQWLIDPALESELKIDLGAETIIVKIKDKDYRLPTYRGLKSLNNHYVYIGLQKALYQLLKDLSKEDEISLEDDIDNLGANELHYKLLNYLRSKKVDKLNYENIDEVIYKMSSNIISKQASDLRRFIEDGN